MLKRKFSLETNCIETVSALLRKINTSTPRKTSLIKNAYHFFSPSLNITGEKLRRLDQRLYTDLNDIADGIMKWLRINSKLLVLPFLKMAKS
jgi:hypothetical protein